MGTQIRFRAQVRLDHSSMQGLPCIQLITRPRAWAGAARLHRELTQEQVAIRTGIDRATYNRIEQGHASPLLDSLILIADAIGVPLTGLVAL
ncbi:helix-turn-helix domain-containing protein [Streptomyces sp. YS-3]|uniref:helix-turn-helix domain-containing protein n=1 Tax=Streptomyces sp. YS-3 TaxID=3381352 RepID=UPI003862AEF7